VYIEQLQLHRENTWQSTSVWQKSIVLNGNWREVGHNLCTIFIGFTQHRNKVGMVA